MPAPTTATATRPINSGPKFTGKATNGKAVINVRNNSNLNNNRQASSSTSNTNSVIPNGVPPAPSPHASPYQIMASRIANRVAEMAENITFVERQREPPSAPSQPPRPLRPRKLEIRLPTQADPQHPDITFSAAFLDNALRKLLDLQARMLETAREVAEQQQQQQEGEAAAGVPEHVKREVFAQAAELSRVIALICAEKARVVGV